MKTYVLVAIATLLLFATFDVDQSQAVDSRRAASQASRAPGWAESAAVISADPLRAPVASPLSAAGPRDRSVGSVQPNWNNPAKSPATVVDPWYTPDSAEANLTVDRWRLGIYPEDTDTGVRISEIVNSSAAERAGLEVNDRIISVHGYQVGYVDSALFDVGKELERHADDDGWVRMLVQNNRDGKLMNLPVQLDPRQRAITGTITYRDRSALPRDAVATVELNEILRADLRPIMIKRQTISPAPRVPIPFKLEYDPSEVDSSRRYVLSATISAGGRQLYALRQDVPVLDGRPSDNVQLVVETAARGPSAVPNRNEQLEQISQWFREYLGREPRNQELYGWESHLARGGSLADAQLQILSTPEFYYQANGDDTQYIYRMFQLVTQRQPSQQEVSQWLNRLKSHHRLRSDMAREFLAMANSQARR